MATLTVFNNTIPLVVPKNMAITPQLIKDKFSEIEGISSLNSYHYIGKMSDTQYWHVQAMLTGHHVNDRSAYKSHRKGYVYSDAVKKIANDIRQNCTGNAKICVASVTGKSKPLLEHKVTSFTEHDPPQCKFELRCMAPFYDGVKDVYTCHNTLEEAQSRVKARALIGECLRGSISAMAKQYTVNIDHKEVPTQDLKFFQFTP